MTLNLPTPGGDRGTWGAKLNAALTALEQADGDAVTAAGKRFAQLDVTENRRRMIAPGIVLDTVLDDPGFNAFGEFVQFASGKMVAFTPRQTSDGAGPASIYTRVSTDGGLTFGPSTLFIADGGTGLAHNHCQGGVTSNNRGILAYSDRNQSTGVINAMHVIYTDDEAETWSAPFTITMPFTGAGAWYGGLVNLPGGRLMLSLYGLSPVSTTYVIFSDDNGATWGNTVTVLADGAAGVTESSYLHLGGGQLIGLSRTNSSVNQFRQVKSTDSGATWTDQGTTTFFSPLVGGQMASELHLLNDGGRQYVVAYFTGGTPLNGLASVQGDPAGLIAGVSGWDATSVQQVSGLATRGYPNFIHPEGQSQGLGLGLRDTSATECDLVVIPWDAAARPDEFWIPASALVNAGGTERRSTISSRTPVILLDAATSEDTYTSFVVPKHWRTFFCEAWWANTVTAAGNVRFQFVISDRQVGSPGLNTGTESVNARTGIGNGVAGQWSKAFLATLTQTLNTNVYTVRLGRLGADAADTLATDAALIGLRITRGR